MKSRSYTLEDNGTGAKVFYHLQLSQCDTSKPNLELLIEKMDNAIYHNSGYQHILFPPHITALQFSFYELIELSSLFVESISYYLKSVRETLYQQSTRLHLINLRGCDYQVKLQAVNKKKRESGKEINSARLMFVVLDAHGDEVIVVRMKMTKLILLLNMIKKLLDESCNTLAVPYDDINGFRLLTIRQDDYFCIGDIWLHGREMHKLYEFVERVIFDFKFKALAQDLFNYRQVAAGFSDIDHVFKLIFIKYTPEHSIFKNSDDEPVVLEFLVVSHLIALIYLLLPKTTELVQSNDVELSQEALSEHTIQVDEKRLSQINQADFMLNMIETQLAIRHDPTQKFDIKNRKGQFHLSCRYRDFILHDQTFQIYSSDENGVKQPIPKLPAIELDLGIDWLYIFATLAESVHSADEMKHNEYGMYVNNWEYKKAGLFSEVDVNLRIVSDPENKVPAVMLIDKYDDTPFSDIARSKHRLRIPLFREHIRTLLRGVIRLGAQMPEYYWSRSFPAFSDLYDDYKGKHSLGLRRFYDEKEGCEKVSFGIIGKSSMQLYLLDSDRDTLFFSAYYRLMYGRWLQFSGSQIALSFDGWITDRYNEYKIELDIEDSPGSRGSLAALAIIMSTLRGQFHSQR